MNPTTLVLILFIVVLACAYLRARRRLRELGERRAVPIAQPPRVHPLPPDSERRRQIAAQLREIHATTERTQGRRRDLMEQLATIRTGGGAHDD